MAYALSYPQTRYTPEPLVDFNSAEERKRLSGSALIGFFKMMEIWKVRDEDARTLLGGISNGPFYELKKNPKGASRTFSEFSKRSIFCTARNWPTTGCNYPTATPCLAERLLCGT
jgi:hypothetical protein